MAPADFCPNCFAPGFGERCPHCGYLAISQAGNHLILAPGTLLRGRYLLGRTLGAGGFGITYLARDNTGGTLCAIKEYLPNLLAVRNADTQDVYPSSTSNRETFEHGLKVFQREAQVLRQFAGNGSIVQVYDYFEQNGTAYFVMEYLDGVTLKALMRSMGGQVPLGLASEVLQEVAATLEKVHGQGLLHRDVSPENIFVTKNGEIKLIDFGATRFFVGERSQSLSVILKPGFAPPEQYSSKGNQGPWTDLYALCATFLNALTGQSLPDAPDRLAGAGLPRVAGAAPGIYPPLAAAVEQGLSLDWRQRPQSMAAFLQQANGGQAAAPAGTPPPIPQHQAAQNPEQLRGTPFVQVMRGGLAGDKWIIPKNMAMSIGRSSEQCNIVLEYPNVSRVHCTVEYNEKSGCFYLIDLSTNGTLTEAGRIEKNRPHPLRAGETFYISTREYAMKVGLE